MTEQQLTKEEKIIDESYDAVIVLSEAQLKAHVASADDKRRGMCNIRITLQDGKVVTTSTNGKALLQVTEDAGKHTLDDIPQVMNPAEVDNQLARKSVVYLPAAVCNDILSVMPKRRNFRGKSWQRKAVFSLQDSMIEAGHANKQGEATITTYPTSEWTSFPPVEKLLADGTKPDMEFILNVTELAQLLSKLNDAGVKTASFKLHTIDKNKPVRIDSLEGVHGRSVTALLMPMKKMTSFGLMRGNYNGQGRM